MTQRLVSPGATGWGAKQWLLVAAALVGLLVVGGVVAAVTPLGLLAAILATAGALFTLLGLLKLRESLAARSVEVEPVGSLGGGEGAVAVEGTARVAEETLTTQLSGTDSVAYQVEVHRAEPTKAGGGE